MPKRLMMDQPPKPPTAPTPPQRDDVTLTLFDALQATKPAHRAASKGPNAIEVVGVATEEPGFAGLPISPKLVIALGVTLVVTLGVWLIPKSTGTKTKPIPMESAQTPAQAPIAATPPRPLPRGAPPVQRNWSTVSGSGAAAGNARPASAATSSEDREREKERERDREYEREREREKRRQMDAWRANDTPQIPARVSDDPSMIDGARGYKDPGAVLRDRERNMNPDDTR